MLRTTRFSFIVLITAIHNHELLPLFPIAFSLFRDRPIIFLIFLRFSPLRFVPSFVFSHLFTIFSAAKSNYNTNTFRFSR